MSIAGLPLIAPFLPMLLAQSHEGEGEGEGEGEPEARHASLGDKLWGIAEDITLGVTGSAIGGLGCLLTVPVAVPYCAAGGSLLLTGAAKAFNQKNESGGVDWLDVGITSVINAVSAGTGALAGTVTKELGKAAMARAGVWVGTQLLCHTTETIAGYAMTGDRKVAWARWTDLEALTLRMVTGAAVHGFVAYALPRATAGLRRIMPKRIPPNIYTLDAKGRIAPLASTAIDRHAQYLGQPGLTAQERELARQLLQDLDDYMKPNGPTTLLWPIYLRNPDASMPRSASGNPIVDIKTMYAKHLAYQERVRDIAVLEDKVPADLRPNAPVVPMRRNPDEVLSVNMAVCLRDLQNGQELVPSARDGLGPLVTQRIDDEGYLREYVNLAGLHQAVMQDPLARRIFDMLTRTDEAARGVD